MAPTNVLKYFQQLMLKAGGIESGESLAGEVPLDCRTPAGCVGSLQKFMLACAGVKCCNLVRINVG